MTQEEKQLLLIDLCARLPYNIIMNGKLTNNIGRDNIDFVLEPTLLAAAIACGCKPYLRPMSSMAEEEKNEYDRLCVYCLEQDAADYNISILDRTQLVFVIDWLNSHHFDHRGLIPMGLALPASEDMYNTKTE